MAPQTACFTTDSSHRFQGMNLKTNVTPISFDISSKISVKRLFSLFSLIYGGFSPVAISNFVSASTVDERQRKQEPINVICLNNDMISSFSFGGRCDEENRDQNRRQN